MVDFWKFFVDNITERIRKYFILRLHFRTRLFLGRSFDIIMLTTNNAMVYEFTVTAGVSLFLFLIQLLTGPMLTWLLWVYSFATVTLGFIDHAVVEWKLSPDVQMRRIMINIGDFLISGLLLYGAACFLLPNIEVKKIMSVIAGFQRLMKVYNYYGPFLHIFVYNLLHFCVLNFIRIFMNFGYLIFGIVYELLNPNLA